MPVPFIDLSRQHRKIRKELSAAVQAVFDSQQFVLKSRGASLESAIAKKLGARHAVALASGSDALYLSLLASGVKPGDEVITSAFTFFATAGAVVRAGAKPVFVDIDPRTCNLRPELIVSKINSKTKAILPVHLFGLACDIKAVMAVARRHSLAVVEDAAQAIGARVDGKCAGTFGDAGCLSFYPTKNLGAAGDAGMVVTSSAKLAEELRLLRDHGAGKKYHHEKAGFNSRLDEVQAAVLLVKLKYLEAWNNARKKIAERYAEGLADLPLKLPKEPKGFTHIYHLYSIQTDRRDALQNYLKKKGIGAEIYYPVPLHLQPCFKALGYRCGDLPEAERVSFRVLSLPMFPELSQKETSRVVETVRDFFKR
jgi:dTDP-4-amino-4,6-dideoxygalactose transaminase